MINTIRDIQHLILEGETDWEKYGSVGTKEFGDFIIFNYTKICQYQARWNYFERVSRGLIFNKTTAEIVARPFPKFFNYFERGLKPSGHMVHAFEKMDGSLGILYRDNGYKIATRGSLNSDQAIWATEFLKNYDLTGLPDEYTLLFEIIYPENRIVVNYGDTEDLVLLAVINRFTGEELPFYGIPSVWSIANAYGFNLPEVYRFNNATEILEWTGRIRGTDDEGCVVVYSDGERFKFKGDDYKNLHRLLSRVSLVNTCKAFQNNELEELLNGVPDETHELIKGWLELINSKYQEINSVITHDFHNAPKGTRREFAEYAQKTEYPQLLFQMLDKNEKLKYTIDEIVLKAIKKENENV